MVPVQAVGQPAGTVGTCSRTAARPAHRVTLQAICTRGSRDRAARARPTPRRTCHHRASPPSRARITPATTMARTEQRTVPTAPRRAPTAATQARKSGDIRRSRRTQVPNISMILKNGPAHDNLAMTEARRRVRPARRGPLRPDHRPARPRACSVNWPTGRRACKCTRLCSRTGAPVGRWTRPRPRCATLIT